MKYSLDKTEIISFISKSLKDCPQLLECVGVFGSFVKKANYRDIDILVIVPTGKDTKVPELWIKKALQKLLQIPLDIKCYDFDSFGTMINAKAHLALSIAVEIEFVIHNPIIEKELTALKGYLFEKGIHINNERFWSINHNVIDDILLEENQTLRGFLVSHLDWIENRNKESEKLLRALTPIEEPYTRVACFKQVIMLMSSQPYREKLNISVEITIELTTQVLSHRTFEWGTYEDYSDQDLCLELVDVLTKLPADILQATSQLLERLICDYNHLVRQKTVNYIHNKVLPIDTSLGFNLLSKAYKAEYKSWSYSGIYDTPFITSKGEIQIDHLTLLLEGYFQNQNDLEFLPQIQRLHKTLQDYSDCPLDTIVADLLEISNQITELEVTLDKFKTQNEIYLSKVLNNVREKSYETITAHVIQKGGIDFNNLKTVFAQVSIAIPPELINELLEITKQLNNTAPSSVEFSTYVVQFHRVIKQTNRYISIGIQKGPLGHLLKSLASHLEQLIRDTKWHQFFSVVPKPRFGLRIDKKQQIRFIVSNLTEFKIPNMHLDIQSSAEINIEGGYKHPKTYQAFEQREENCWLTPLVAKQIAISYKINGDFGKPIYVSADRENPFVPNRPASSAHFVGREAELQLIREEIHQQHFLLFGPRRIGKTSLLYQLKEELGEGYVPIYISLQKFSTANGTQLFDNVIQDITHELGELKKISILDLKTTEDRIQKIKSILEDEILVLLVDEMDVGQEVDGFSTFLERSRAMMQQELSIRFIFSAGPFITKDLVNPRSPLFNTLRHIPINRLTPTASEKLLRLAEDQDIMFKENMIEECLLWTGGLPLYLQILGDQIYQNLKDKDISDRSVSQELLLRVKNTMKSDVVEWDRMWNVLNHLEKAILAFHAYQDGAVGVPQIKKDIEQLSGRSIPFVQIREGLKNLIWYGFLADNSGSYKITSGLIQDWLLNQLYYPEEVKEFFVIYDNDTK